MQRTTFEERKARVLSAHVATRKRLKRAPARRLLAVFSALVTTLICFFLLKGIALAWHGEAVFARAATIEPSDLRLWLTGIDPLTRLIADVLAPARG